MSPVLDEKKNYKNPNAALSVNSKGRLIPLKSDNYRSEFQRDAHRIIYCQPFRRLRHKTQVFFLPHNDHICTRLEHVMHVSSASRTVARHLGLNEDLTEAIGLGHDLGHAPFGHHGESVLSTLAKENNIGTVFQHEIYSLRVVDKLAELDREPQAGLNLTFEVRDGIVSHCGEDFCREVFPNPCKNSLENIKQRKDAGMPATFEGAIVRITDRICYAGRDMEDGLLAGLIKEINIPSPIINNLGRNNGEIVGTLLEDIIDYSQSHADRIGLSEEKHFLLEKLIQFNYDNIYQCDKVEKFKKQATIAIRELYYNLLNTLEKTDRFVKTYPGLPEAEVYNELKRFIKKINYSQSESNAQIVLDFIAGSTDNYVISCLDEIFVPKYII